MQDETKRNAIMLDLYFNCLAYALHLPTSLDWNAERAASPLTRDCAEANVYYYRFANEKSFTSEKAATFLAIVKATHQKAIGTWTSW